ncbi:50S ribosomal protein L23 [Patescibacteria group bacterium]|nr:50S ribosomal protein L23 [Patescibacteria group bacterium]
MEKETQNNNFNIERILVRPRVTEKATISAEDNVYVFDVAIDSNKIQIKEAIKHLYNVEPVKVNIVSIPAKKIVYRGKKGVKARGKKAYVYLKEGDKISIA